MISQLQVSRQFYKSHSCAYSNYIQNRAEYHYKINLLIKYWYNYNLPGKQSTANNIKLMQRIDDTDLAIYVYVESSQSVDDLFNIINCYEKM
ncbi:hypothetical protein pb186bvf_012294 [Paramecium bursaria]